MSFQIVGTAPETVTRSAAINRVSGSDWSQRSGITIAAPTMIAAYGRPQALAWNIGTIGRIRSYGVSPIASPMATAIECRYIDRGRRARPWGWPLVPDGWTTAGAPSS